MSRSALPRRRDKARNYRRPATPVPTPPLWCAPPSRLFAAEKTGRVYRGIELDLLYVDVIVRRYEAATGNPAVLVETGVTFESLALSRASKAPPVGPDPEARPRQS